MNLAERLGAIREVYVELLRRSLAELRDKGVECASEVWVEPPVRPGQPAMPDRMCIDILQTGDDQKMIMVTGPMPPAPPGEMMWVRDVPVTLYAGAWENFAVWVRRPDPDWSALDPWKQKWMDANRPVGEDGLSGVVHYLGAPAAEGGGYFYEIDFGSAPVEAMLELVDALVNMGASEIELGRVDGSKLPMEILEELKQPQVPMDRLAAIVMGLLGELPEVQSIKQVDAETIVLQSREQKGEHRINIGNLFRLLNRVPVDTRPSELNRYIRGQREGLAPTPAPDLSQLRVVVKDDRFIDQISQLGPKMKPLIKTRLAGDLWLTCVWDSPNGMRFATEEDAEVYGMSNAQMLDRAQANFLATHPAPEISPLGQLLLVQTHDCYDTSLLIDPEWLNQMESKWKGGFLACAPARHVLLLGDAGSTTASVEMREAARQIESTGDHLISSTILVRRAGQWEPYHLPPQPAVPPSPHPTLAANPKKPWWRFR